MKIEELKNWRVCKEQLRMNAREEEALLCFHHQAYTIVAVLINDYQ